MNKKLLTHDEALNLVYSTIAALKAEGRTKITVSEVARRSGVNRSTINSKHDDWQEAREVIFTNIPSLKVKLASEEIREQNRWRIEASRLERELQSCNETLVELTEFAESVYKRLLDQLHKYVYEARQVPERMDRESKTLIELSELKKQLAFYESEIRNLKSGSEQNSTVIPLVKKEIVEVFPEPQRGTAIEVDLVDLTMDAMNKLDYYFSKHYPPRVIYVLCGNFASGKSYWISRHKPVINEQCLYFEGTNHSAMLRKLIIRYIRKLNPDCKIVCVRILSDVGQCLKRNVTDARIRNKNNIPEELISIIDKNFEEVSVREGFNEIVIVGGA